MDAMTRVGFGIALGTLLVSVPIAYACDLVSEAQVTEWLGMTWDGTSPTRPPANLASVAPLAEGTSFRVGELELYRVPEGTTEIATFGGIVALDTTPDLTPPSDPEIRSVSLSVNRSVGTCGTIVRVEYDVSTEDDRAPREALTFAIWLSREPRGPVGAPDHLVVVEPYSDALWTYGDEDWEGRDLWAVVQVLDQAGNASGFSEPFLVDTGKRGCTTSGVPTGTLVPLAFGLLLLARRRRR
jgi:MYXO-CTERM domain-containing protein